MLEFLSTNKDAIDALKNLSLILAGIVGLIFLGIRVFAQNKSSISSEHQATIAEKGNVNDRYMKAIEQLGATNVGGDPNFEVRLGAIYGLEQVSLESKDLYPQIIEILAAYVRMNATVPVVEGEVFYLYEFEPRADVQAAVTVLGRRKKIDGDNPIDFSGAFLARYSFVNGDFKNALFMNGYYMGANFIGANCAKACFRSAKCAGTRFQKSDLQKADFTLANCHRANFTRANCKETVFTKGSVSSARFDLANCTKATFKRTNCAKANFKNTNCTGARFLRTNCTDALFDDANLTDTNFVECILKNVDFSLAKKNPTIVNLR